MALKHGPVALPAYVNADYIVIQAEKYRKFFDASLPDEKFLPFGSPKFDKVIRLCNDPPEPPAEWKRKIQGRKVFFYNTSLAGFLDCVPLWLQKLEYVFSIFRHSKNVCLLWRPHPLLGATFKSMRADGGSFLELGSYVMLPILKIFGTEYENLRFESIWGENGLDLFTKASFCFPHGIATATCGLGVKSEGRLLISGTKGHIVVEPPWWKTSAQDALPGAL